MTSAEGVTLDPMTTLRRAPRPHAGAVSQPTAGAAGIAGGWRRGREGISRQRVFSGFALTAAGLPALTATLAAARPHLAFDDDLLLYLVAVVAITLVGGFWPAVLAAAASGLLLNWFFTPPLHTWTIEAPQSLLALVLFVVVAVAVSSVVHLAARRSTLAAHLAGESETMLGLARTVLAGDDSPSAVLDHLHTTLGYSAELVERVGQRWSTVARVPAETVVALTIRPRPDLELRIHERGSAFAPAARDRRVLEAFAAQAAAALDRERLRAQAAQAEALAEGNRMRTALLTAVSHDLRTPLASVKASVSTLRQTDVTWTPDDRAELLATIEEGADRLNALIGNLLDMSRIHTGTLQPLIRSIALDEVVPIVIAGVDGAQRLTFAIPEDLPMLAADPGLLERALANLVANALRYSPAGRPPTLAAYLTDRGVCIDVIDHGPGVPEGQRQEILQPFHQLGDRRSTGGVGLGLAVTKGFVDVMGGQLSAKTTPGGGLTMRIDMPVSAKNPAEASPAGAPS